MAAIAGALRNQIQATLELAADGFETEVPASSHFTAAAETDRVTVVAGFADAGGVVASVRQLKDGVVDAYELIVRPEQLLTRLVGRDPVALLLDRTVRKRFVRFPERPVLDEVPEADLGIETLVADAGTGRWTASEIARNLVEGVGLTLQWEVRDWEPLEDFDAVGRPIDLLRQLVAPWDQVEPFKVDLFVQNDTVIARQRRLAPEPDYRYAVFDARIENLVVRKSRPGRYGLVRLEGEADLGQTGEFTETTQSETLDAAGNVWVRIVETTTFRLPDRIVLKTVRQVYGRSVVGVTRVEIGGSTTFTVVYGLRLISERTITYEWDSSLLDRGQIVNLPRLRRVRNTGTQLKSFFWFFTSDVTTLQALDQIATEAPLSGPEDTDFTYDAEGFLKEQLRTARHTLNGLPTEQEIISYQRIGPAQYLESVMLYRGQAGKLTLVSHRTRLQGGYPPGGPVGGAVSGPTPASIQEPKAVSVQQTISTDPTAQDVIFTNRSLTKADLDFILSLYQQASGLWQYELTFDAVTMPWLTKGTVIELTGLLAEDGVTPIVLKPALVVDHRLLHDETSRTPSMRSRVRAVYWSPT